MIQALVVGTNRDTIITLMRAGRPHGGHICIGSIPLLHPASSRCNAFMAYPEQTSARASQTALERLKASRSGSLESTPYNPSPIAAYAWGVPDPYPPYLAREPMYVVVAPARPACEERCVLGLSSNTFLLDRHSCPVMAS